MNRLFILPLLAFTALSSAHDALPHANWCTGSRQHPVLVSSVTLTPQEITDYRNTQQSSPPAPTGQLCGRGPTLRDCGDHPDDWTTALELAGNHCAVMEAGRIVPGSDLYTVVALVTHPSYFYTGLSSLVGQNTHHEDYSAALGLRASCMRCEPRVQHVGNTNSADAPR